MQHEGGAVVRADAGGWQVTVPRAAGFRPAQA